MNQIKSFRRIYRVLILAVVLLGFIPTALAKADTAAAVSFGTINYELLTLQVYNNSNSVVFYSTDSTNWTELEGAYNSTTKSFSMDISWVSAASDTTLYFKGDVVKTVRSLVLPAQNTSFGVDYDRAEGTFTFSNSEEADNFEWRKNTDYCWKTVNLDENSSSYTAFMKTIEQLKVKGATIIVRLPQVKGTGADNVGERASKDVSVIITARAAAPALKVNSSKLTINTTPVMEYYDSVSDLWIECTTAMGLDEIAPQVLYNNGATSTSVRIRKSATSSAPSSKTAILTIPAQKPAPSIGDSSADITYYSMNSKLMLQFNKASSTNLYEYVIIREESDFNPSTASWKSVNSPSMITISAISAPEGSTVYVRKKGTDANSSGAGLVLASAAGSFLVKY